MQSVTNDYFIFPTTKKKNNLKIKLIQYTSMKNNIAIMQLMLREKLDECSTLENK